MCGDKSTTFYLCFYLLIRQRRSVGHVWRDVNHVLFEFLSLKLDGYVVWDMCRDMSSTFYLRFYLFMVAIEIS